MDAAKMMRVGQEFSCWESFQRFLDLYSQQNKVVYVVGTCKAVQTANRNELLRDKFPLKFRYCFARMVCKHFGSYASKSAGQRPNQRTCKTGCTSSILVSVDKKRTRLVIKEANLQHSHAVSESIFSGYPQTRRLQGDERRMASVLLRAGVPLLRVQEFISHACRKGPTIKDLQNLRCNTLKAQGPSQSDGVDAEEFAFLNDVDKLMAEDSGSIVEIINFDLVPGAIYIQTSSMIEMAKTLQSGMLQVVTHPVNEGKVSVVSIVGVDANFDPYVLALCVIMVISDTALRCFFEAFVRNNPMYCDSVNGIVVDCSKETAEFLQHLVPQAQLAWSNSYVLRAFAEEAAAVSTDVEQHLQLCRNLMDAGTETEYEQNLKCLMMSLKVSDYKEFLNTWDSSKDLWATYAIYRHPNLRHRRTSTESRYLDLMKTYLKASMTSSELIRALLRFVRHEDPERHELEHSKSLSADPSCNLYRQLCFPEAYHAIEYQIALALNSVHEFKQESNMIFMKRKDTEEECLLDVSGSKCTCPYFIKEELPCQHIFAWLKFSGKPLYDESLVPEKWQVFGGAITLEAIAESLAQGQVPSALDHDERIKEVQKVMRDILASCCAHSYQQMSRDLVLLRQLLLLMKNSSSYDAKVVLKKSDSSTLNYSPIEMEQEPSEASVSESSTAPRKPGRPPGKRGRGRPSNKERLLRMMQEEEGTHGQDSHSTHTAKSTTGEAAPAPPAARHNLRRNIKHKFVSREDSSSSSSRLAAVASVAEGQGHDGNTEEDVREPAGGLSVVQVEEDEDKVVTSVLNQDRTEMYRAVRPKGMLLPDSSSLPVEADGNNSIETTGMAAGNDRVDIIGGVQVKEGQGADKKLGDTKKRYNTGLKRPREESEDENEETSGSNNSGEDTDDEDIDDHETVEERRKRRKDEISIFINGFSHESLNAVLQTVSMMDTSEEREQQVSVPGGETASQHPSDVLINSCDNFVEVDLASAHIATLCPGFDQCTYQVASALVCKAHLLTIPVTDLLQTLSSWPSHLPDFPVSRPFEGEVSLDLGQTLTVCGRKLVQDDMDSLRPGKEISSEIVHAYLEILAQKHSGKMFVLPFSLVHAWRSGGYTDMLFKKVHFKTFEYLVLPIHCGGEFTLQERESGDLMQPCWMVLVADVTSRTVSVLNPRTEDRYVIAANGYMLQWRRYMQIRSVHTREMLSVWTTRHIDCSKTDTEGSSAIMLLMNVEAVISGVHPAVMHPLAHSSRYRHHVAACLRDTDWQTTVLCVGGPECQRQAARDADWVLCENCRAWWHRACATLGADGDNGSLQNKEGSGADVGNFQRASAVGEIGNSRKTAAGVFYCTSCRQRIRALGGGGRGGGGEGGGGRGDNDVVNDEEEEEEEEEDGREEDEAQEMEYEEEEEGEEEGETMRIEEVGEEEKGGEGQ